ncbi:MAG TPA: hypothetical protein VFF27_08910 [Bacteroidia bacterium]|jgi:hypothetical protein|nr:hypothetical protein [Bacteroidia bacterium]
MKNTLLLGSFFLFIHISCTVLDKKAEHVDEATLAEKNRVYRNVHKIAEAFPFTQEEAFTFFNELDSLHSKKFRNNSSQQFQYDGYTVFYAQPGHSKKVKGLGIDIDSTAHVSMEQLGAQLGITWHSTDLIEIKAGKIHYRSIYTDAQKEKKEIHITLNLSADSSKEVTFISIDRVEEELARN